MPEETAGRTARAAIRSPLAIPTRMIEHMRSGFPGTPRVLQRLALNKITKHLRLNRATQEPPRDQNGPTRPTSLRIVWRSAIVFRRQFRSRRSLYHLPASLQSRCTSRIAPTAIPRRWHHASTSPSDWKSRIVPQVKPISRHQSRAGTAKCTTPALSTKALPANVTRSACPEFGQAVDISPSTPSKAKMPNASQMQFPHHWISPERTRNEVGTAENGSAIQMYGLPGMRTARQPLAEDDRALVPPGMASRRTPVRSRPGSERDRYWRIADRSTAESQNRGPLIERHHHA